ncbi:putative lipid II flippase FtsW [Candidatus Kuenenbacteria bacterium]|nr:putative lipid II flippase FtsW [Candidatus Kuenenbacteria bacterium]
MQKLAHKPDYVLITLFWIIVVFGLIMLSSASSVLGYYTKGQDSYWYVKHQLLFGFLPGAFFFYVMSRIDYRFWKRIAPLLFLFSIGLLGLVFIPGIGSTSGTNAKSWINIFGFSLQPAEIVKLTFLLYLSAWLERRREKVKDFAYGFLQFLIYLGLIATLVILQPDIGTVSIIIFTSIVVYYAAGAQISHLFLILIGAVAGFFALIKIAPYRLARLTAFLDPSADPQGVGYHIKQALLAVGSGGLLGLGLGQSKQKFQYLPEVAGDSIFAIMAEELGFIIITIFIVLFLALFLRIIKVASKTDDLFGHLVAVGVAVWILGQFFVNVGAMLGILPLTGLPLPLVSYGGTAMMVTMAAVGIVVNISRQTQEGIVTKNIKNWK